MITKVVQNFRLLLNEIERTLFFMGNKFPPGFGFAEIDVSSQWNSATPQKTFSIQEFMQDGILWGVPKRRRTIERRHTRRFGILDRVYKLQLPHKDLLVCVHCGYDHKRGYLCKNCYAKVMEETKRMQDRISEELKLDPLENDVVVLYKGEKESQPQEFWKGKRIVEMLEERPPWFSRNLLQKTTTTTSDVQDVKPDKLG